MLRCPKCSRIYQSGANRFCTHDGGRLVSVAETNHAAENASPVGDFGVSNNESGADWQPRRQTGRLVLPPQLQPAANGFAASRLTAAEPLAFNSEIVDDLPPAARAAAPLTDRRPTGRLVLPSDIPDSFAPTGDRSINPTGRLAITPENTSALVGQNVKGRYAVDKVLQRDDLTVTYLAHDRLGEYRQVLIKIWLKVFTPEADETRRFYEERGALSHLNHPNIARILDAGDLTEGKPFIITEFPEGLSLREAMQITGRFSPGRTARVIRQIAQALTEAHNNRLIHRNLKPENVMLKNDGAIEQVKVFNFGVAGDEPDKADSLAYTAPECLIGRLSHIEGDIFALGVIAFEMLTGRKPFAGRTEDELLDSEELGLALKPTNLRLDLSPAVDAVLERALAYSRAERYHHAREFGESLFNALTESAVYKPTGTLPALPIIAAENIAAENIAPEITVTKNSVAENIADESAADEIAAPEKIVPETPIVFAETEIEAVPLKKSENTEIKKVELSPPVPAAIAAATKGASGNKAKWLIASVLVVAAAALAIAYLNYRNQREPATNEPAYVFQPAQPRTETPNAPVEQPLTPAAETAIVEQIQMPPVPPNFVRFENSKTDLDGKLAENYVPFSLSYPQNWERNEVSGKPGAANFLDISNRLANNLPLEQLLVSWYESRGTFQNDRETFPTLVKKLTAAYAEEIPAFRKISEGETTLNGRAAYEVKFTGKIEDTDRKNIQIYGRTIFLPIGNDNGKSGLLLTMLATNLTPVISNPNDVGEKGELKEILNTFEIASAASSVPQ